MRAMFLLVALMALTARANAEQYDFNDPNMPIRTVRTSTGEGDHIRVEHLAAVIAPHHVRTGEHIRFPKSGPLKHWFESVRAVGDEYGYLVGSQFSGPATWYNFSPQNIRVNRNAAYQALTTEWYGAECEARRFLNGGSDRRVYWTVDMTFVGSSNRPDKYHLQVRFEGPNGPIGRDLDIWIRNLFNREDSTYWICQDCRTHRHEPDELLRRELIEYGCSRV